MENNSKLEAYFELVKQELIKAETKNGPFHSAHEGWAVLYEEVDELWEEVRKKKKNRVSAEMAAECVQIAASAIRFALDVCEAPIESSVKS
jgi:hypothetical protein